MIELSSEAKALLREASDAFEPGPEQLEHAGSALMQKVLGVQAAPAAVSGKVLVLVKAVGALLFVGALSVVGYAALSTRASSPDLPETVTSMPVATAAPEVVAAPPLAANAAQTAPSPTLDDSAPPPRRPQVRKPESRTPVRVAATEPAPAVPAPATVATPEDSLAHETGLIRAARAALKRGDSALALRSVAEHAARFPNGALREERVVTEVMALCAQRKQQPAVEALRRLGTLSSDSPYAAQLSRSCAAKR